MFLKQFLLVLFSGLVAILAEPCSQGEGYWCRSFENAEACKATQHCKTTAWKNELWSNDESENCVFCESIINDVLTYVDMKDEENPKKFMALSCQLLLDKKQSDQCHDLINKHYHTIIDMIKDKIDGKSICSLLSLCASDKVAKHVQQEKMKTTTVPPPSNDQVLCDDCIKLMGDLGKEWFTDQNVDKIVHEVDVYICENLFVVRTYCNEVAEQIVRNIFANLKSKFNPSQICYPFCHYKSLVSEQETMGKFFRQLAPILIKAKYSETDMQHICRMVVDDVKNLFKDGSFIHLVKNIARDDICMHLGQYAEKCTEAVNTYADMVFDFIVNELDSKSFCSRYTAPLTTSPTPTTPVNHPPTIPPTPTTPVNHNLKWYPIYKALNKKADVDVVSYPSSSSSSSYSSSNDDERRNNPAFSYSSSSSSDDDDDEERRNNPAFSFAKSSSASSSSSSSSSASSSSSSSSSSSVTFINPVCTMCKFLINELRKAIGSNKTEERVVEALENVCKLMPAEQKKECVEFIEKYGHLLIDFLIGDFTSEVICHAIQVCVMGRDDQKKPLGDSKCEICEVALNYLESMLDSNESVEQIEFLVSKVCKLMPQHQKMTCLNIVEEFGPMLVHYIATHAPPKKICSLLNLCQGPNKSEHLRCVAGPSFWCASQQNAELCLAEEHCKKFVWV